MNIMRCIAWMLTCAALGTLAACGGSSSTVAAAGSHINFNDDIRPILSENCFKCHGPDTATRKAGLRLDLPEPAYGEVPEDKGHYAIVPGKPSKSELIRRIIATDAEKRMPKGKPPLSAQQIDVLTAWVKEGAPYKPLWSLIAPERPAIAKTALDAQAHNDIDRLIYARLQKAGLQPAPEADRATLINRVSLTLTGLPPSLQDVDAFARDQRPDAYEKLVDRLLASPAYGERMASVWMNLARWADTDGSLDDHHDRVLWPWRDWVIDSFQKNMPFNQFVTWQLAGDLLPNRSRDQLLATTFLRLGERTTENGALNEQFRIESVVDKTNTIGTAFLGLTVGCARCHDHKYDVISQKDYYSLSGFFNSLDEPGVYAPGYTGLQGGPTLTWPTPQQQARLTQAQAAVRETLAAYQQARTAATTAALPKLTALRDPPPGVARVQQARFVPTRLETATASPTPSAAGAAQLLRASLDQAQVAYYPFDALQPISPADYPQMRRPPAQLPPAELMLQLHPRGPPPPPPGAKAGPPPPPPVVSRSYVLERMQRSPSAQPGVPPAFIQEAKLGPGARQQALYFTATNKGYLGRDVAYFERTQAFSFDFWFYPADKYKTSVPVFSHCNAQGSDSPDSGVTGYELEYDQQHLVFYMAHVRPHNMLAVTVKQELPLKQWVHVTLAYDGSSRASGLQVFLNGKPAAVDVMRDNLTASIIPRGNAGLLLEEFVGLSFGTRFREPAPVDSALDEFRIYNRALTPIEARYLNDGDAALTASAQDRALGAQLAEVAAASDARVLQARRALDAARERENQITSSLQEVLVMGDTPTPRPTYLLHRGSYDQHEAEVPVQGLGQVFGWDSKQLPADRRGLASWLLDRKNPLTARVFVNRLWQMHFGTGLVKTAEDFGSQGTLPSNPELLDWMAVEFMDSGWDIKRLQKLIVMSATYRQDSEANAEMRVRDPANTLLARGPRFRMTAEMIRDSALADAGLLVPKIGGPSVFPYQPEGIWDPGNTFYTYPKPSELPAEDQHRRSLYTFVKRNALHSGMQLLDAADPNVSTVKLNAANTPLQALLLLNDPQYQEAYRLMATRAMRAGGEADAQIKMVFRLARRLAPTTAQVAVLRGYYDGQMQRYRADRAAAAQLVQVGVAPIDRQLDSAGMAALTNVAAVIMNTPDSYFIR